ncbi:hypothetical protein FQN51_001114, partial [Onygenales sp. PD_10]
MLSAAGYGDTPSKSRREEMALGWLARVRSRAVILEYITSILEHKGAQPPMYSSAVTDIDPRPSEALKNIVPCLSTFMNARKTPDPF